MIGAKETATALRMALGCKDTPRAPGRPQESSGLLTNAHRGKKHPGPGKEASKRLEERYLVHKQTKGSCCFPRARLEHLIIHRHWIECSGRLLSSAAFCHSGEKNGRKASLRHGNQEAERERKEQVPSIPSMSMPTVTSFHQLDPISSGSHHLPPTNATSWGAGSPHTGLEGTFRCQPNDSVPYGGITTPDLLDKGLD